MSFQKVCSSLYLLSLVTISAVHAEGNPLVFVDVYGGYSWTQEQTLKFRGHALTLPSELKVFDLTVSNGPMFGGRIGAWLKTAPNFGFAVGATRFDSDIDRQSSRFRLAPNPFTLTGTLTGPIATVDRRAANTFVGFDFIYRHPMESFTPYVVIAPGIMFSYYEGVDKMDVSDTSFGFSGGGGLSYRLSDSMHIFTEYRYMHAEPEFKIDNSTDFVTIPGLTIPTGRRKTSFDIDAHAVYGGVSIRF